MSKFHINKHGVPAPCHAKEGNCPLGGGENHFDTQEEAQEAIDKLNEEEFGVMGVTNPTERRFDAEIEIDKDHFGYLFYKSYNNHGYLDVGVHTSNMLDEQLVGLTPGEANPLLEVRKELEAKVPEVFDGKGTTIIPAYNAEDYFRAHVVNKSSEEYETKDNYNAMVETAKNNAPNQITYDNYLEIDEMSNELESKIQKFAAEKTIEESGLTINGEKFIVGTYDDRNWAEEYFANNA